MSLSTRTRPLVIPVEISLLVLSFVREPLTAASVIAAWRLPFSDFLRWRSQQRQRDVRPEELRLLDYDERRVALTQQYAHTRALLTLFKLSIARKDWTACKAIFKDCASDKASWEQRMPKYIDPRLERCYRNSPETFCSYHQKYFYVAAAVCIGSIGSKNIISNSSDNGSDNNSSNNNSSNNNSSSNDNSNNNRNNSADDGLIPTFIDICRSCFNDIPVSPPSEAQQNQTFLEAVLMECIISDKLSYAKALIAEFPPSCFVEGERLWTKCVGWYAAKYGRMHILEWALQEGIMNVKEVEMGAAAGGNIQILQWVHNKNNQKWISELDLMCVAASYGQLNVMKWMYDNGYDHGLLNSTVFSVAAGGGHIHVLEWLKEQGCWYDNCLDYGVRSGKIEAIQWLLDTGSEMSTEACRVAAGISLDLLKWLREKGCPWSPSTSAGAARRGHLETLKWAYENGCDMDEDTTDSACISRSEDCFQYAIENDCPMSDEFYLRARKMGWL